MSNLNKKGVSLYLALVIMAILFSISLMASTILLGQIRMIKGMGDSVIAFYAADTGIEKTLLYREDPMLTPGQDIEVVLDNGATYKITVFSTGAMGCNAENSCIQSIGSYKDTKRAIEVEY